MEVERGTAQGAGICGVISLVCGIASVISGIIWVAIHGFGGFGIWSGFGLIIAGVLGVIVWWKRYHGVLVGFLIVTIIMILVASGQAIGAGVWYGVHKVFADSGICVKSNGKCRCIHGIGTGNFVESFCDKPKPFVDSLLAITIFNVIGAIICFVGSIFGCIGTCCATTQSQPGAVVVQRPVVMTTTQQSYVAQQPGYVQQHGYAPQQAGYPQQQQPGYAPQPATVNPPQGAPPEYTEKH